MPLASPTVLRHLVRGAAGLLALVTALASASHFGPAALLLLIVSVLAWRGCPTCWVVGLLQTVEQRNACRARGRCG